MDNIICQCMFTFCLSVSPPHKSLVFWYVFGSCLTQWTCACRARLWAQLFMALSLDVTPGWGFTCIWKIVAGPRTGQAKWAGQLRHPAAIATTGICAFDLISNASCLIFVLNFLHQCPNTTFLSYQRSADRTMGANHFANHLERQAVLRQQLLLLGQSGQNPKMTKIPILRIWWERRKSTAQESLRRSAQTQKRRRPRAWSRTHQRLTRKTLSIFCLISAGGKLIGLKAQMFVCRFLFGHIALEYLHNPHTYEHTRITAESQL